MNNRFTKAAAAFALAVAAVFAAPLAANAYTPSGPASGTVTIAPGGTGTVAFTGFAPGESVTFKLTGENASGATLAFVKFAIETKSTVKTASSTGSASVAVTLPSNASGTYTLTATGATSGTSVSTTITVGAAALPSTGGNDESLLGIWIGGGALVLAGAGIAVASTVRRNRHEVKAAA